jgi:hypothetical protein
VRRKAATMLRARGLKPTGIARVATFQFPMEVATQRHLFGRILDIIAPPVSAEQFNGYEIIAESWNDGDNSTWEGNVYVRELSTGQWQSANEQQDLPSEPYEVNWTDEVGTNQQGRPGCQKAGSPCGLCTDPGAVGCNLRRAVDDRWPYCAGGAAACVAAGPVWLQCAGLQCYGQLFGGWLWQSKNHFSQCWRTHQERIDCTGA